MRCWLAYNADACFWRKPKIVADSNSINHVTVVVVALSDEPRSGCVEAGMQNRKHKPAAGAQCPKRRFEQWRDAGHVHNRHIADGSIELRRAQRSQLVGVGKIDQAIFDAVTVLDAPGASTVEKFLTEIAREHSRAELSQSSRKKPVSARQIHDNLSAAEVK
jgi:hypothetical protein